MKKISPLVLVVIGSWLNVSSQINTWTQVSSLPSDTRQWASCFSMGDKIYVGIGGSLLLSPKYYDFWVYNVSSDAWTQKADFPVDLAQAASFSINGKGYIACGYTAANKLYEYDPVADTWTERDTLPASMSRDEAVGFSIGSFGYVCCGDNYGASYHDLWRYDPATDSWLQMADFPGEQRNGLVAFSIGGKAYAGTGWADSGFKRDFYEYDPATDIWTSVADFPGTKRHAAVAFSIMCNELEGRGYVGLGIDSSGFTQDFYEYNPYTDTWWQVADFAGLPRARLVGASAGTAGYIGTGYVSGGVVDNDFWKYVPEFCNVGTVIDDATKTANGIRVINDAEHGELKIVTDQPSASVELFDVAGRKIFSEFFVTPRKEFTVSTSSFTEEIYFIQIDRKFVSKVFISRQ
ncbi:MAG TPA: hypothetical protein VE978_27365 [Chitinophagales bacterium]|nr:hypothetical protein [Chitinophagales bacterium]